jgi:Sensors of blue-light using FAD
MDYCTVYLSSSTGLLSEDELSSILDKSQKNNRASGITGILLYFNGNIIQVLEGPEEIVKSLYQTISHDHRHSNVINLLSQPIEQRSFSDWTMGYKTLSATELNDIKGLIPSTVEGLPMMPDPDNVVLALVKIFYQNNYRN